MSPRNVYVKEYRELKINMSFSLPISTRIHLPIEMTLVTYKTTFCEMPTK